MGKYRSFTMLTIMNMRNEKDPGARIELTRHFFKDLAVSQYISIGLAR